MIPLQSFVNIPTFATSPIDPLSTPSSIGSTTYNGGYVPGQNDPAEHYNFFLNGLTSNVNSLITGLDNTISEITSVLTQAGITPNGSLTNQLLAALNAWYSPLASPAFTGTATIPSLVLSSQANNIDMNTHNITGIGNASMATLTVGGVGATSSDTASSPMIRDSSGRAQVADAATSLDIVNLETSLSGHGIKAYYSAGTYSWTSPVGITNLYVTGSGPGGNGASGLGFGHTSPSGGGGGGGGEYCVDTLITVSPGTTYSLVVGTTGNSTTIIGGAVTFILHTGNNGANGSQTGATGGTGGNGFTGATGSNATVSGNGGMGANALGYSSLYGGNAPSGNDGSGNPGSGALGGNGIYGAGGGGGGASGINLMPSGAGGAGGNGFLILKW